MVRFLPGKWQRPVTVSQPGSRPTSIAGHTHWLQGITIWRVWSRAPGWAYRDPPEAMGRRTGNGISCSSALWV